MNKNESTFIYVGYVVCNSDVGGCFVMCIDEFITDSSKTAVQ